MSCIKIDLFKRCTVSPGEASRNGGGRDGGREEWVGRDGGREGWVGPVGGASETVCSAQVSERRVTWYILTGGRSWVECVLRVWRAPSAGQRWYQRVGH